jgi:hypothetical protein
LTAAAYAALACFAIEYTTLFSGVSIFFRTLNFSHILLHFVGAILAALFYTQVGAIHSCTQGGVKAPTDWHDALHVVD